MSKAGIRPLPIPTETIFVECRIYKQWEELYLRKGQKHTEIELPKLKATPGPRGLTGSFLHTILVILRSAAMLLGLYRIQEWASWKRIETDSFSYEPEACGMHSAFTNIGLARLELKDLDGAIHSLRASCRVHPCPHTTSFGLKRSLRNALVPYVEAKEAIAEFDSFAREFGGKQYWNSLRQ